MKNMQITHSISEQNNAKKHPVIIESLKMEIMEKTT